MEKYLVFYRVDNPFDFDRHSFDAMDDAEACKNLKKLLPYYDEGNDKDYVRFYNTSAENWQTDFATDFNDELLDDGWWCINITVAD